MSTTTIEKTGITAEQARQISGDFYLGRQEAAAYLGVSAKFLATHLRDGPRHSRAGAKTIYRLGELDRWMKAKEVAR